MDSSEARDHLRMVDSIVRNADLSLHMPPIILIALGAVATTVTALIQARHMGLPIPPDQYIQPPLLLLMVTIIGITAWKGRGTRRETLVDAFAGTMFLAVAVVIMTVNVTAQHRVIPAAGMGLVWAAGFDIALLVIGAMGSRPLLLGGVAMLITTAAASLTPEWYAALLAAGWFAGFVIPGLVLLLGTPRGRAASL